MEFLRHLRFKSKRVLVISIAALLMIAVPLTVYMAQTQQNIQQEAAGKKKQKKKKKDNKKDNTDKNKNKQANNKNDKKDNKTGKNAGKAGQNKQNKTGQSQQTDQTDETVDEGGDETVDENTDQQNGDTQEEEDPGETQLAVQEISFIAGDANDDGEINILDYSIITSCYEGFTDLTGDEGDNSEDSGNTDETDVQGVATDASCDEFAREGSDLDDNGPVDVIDLNLFLREISTHKRAETPDTGDGTQRQQQPEDTQQTAPAAKKTPKKNR